MVQVIVMTSDNQAHCLKGFYSQWDRYSGMGGDYTLLCGFSLPDLDPNYGYWDFYSIGEFKDYPTNKWSNALIKVLDEVADGVFILLLEDYWLTRQIDTKALSMVYDYMQQFQNVIRFDLTDERLYAQDIPAPEGCKGHIIANKYSHGMNTYDTLGHLDLIKSTPSSHYHMSLWGAMWRRDLLKEILVPDETAQEIEIRGTGRLSERDDLLVLGTRQCPMRHANVIQRGEWNKAETTGLPALKESDLEELKGLGYV